MNKYERELLQTKKILQMSDNCNIYESFNAQKKPRQKSSETRIVTQNDLGKAKLSKSVLQSDSSSMKALEKSNQAK